MIHYPVSLSLPPDVVVTSDGTEFLNITAYAFCFGGFFGRLLLLVLTVATSFALATVAPCGTMSLLGVASCFSEGSVPVLAVTLEQQTALK